MLRQLQGRFHRFGAAADEQEVADGRGRKRGQDSRQLDGSRIAELHGGVVRHRQDLVGHGLGQSLSAVAMWTGRVHPETRSR